MTKILKGINAIIARDETPSATQSLYDFFMLMVIIASVVPLMFVEELPFFACVEHITVAIFIMDYIARWITAPLRSKRGRWAYLTYPFSPMAIIDLLSIVPVISFVNDGFKLFRLTRLVRIVRIFKIFHYSRKIEVLGRVLYKERQVLISVLLLAVSYIFITALIMFNVEPRINEATGETTFPTFFDALYWASVTLTTVGYGDICPVSSIGRFVSILSSLFGVAIIALPSGVITASYLDEVRRGKQGEREGTLEETDAGKQN